MTDLSKYTAEQLAKAHARRLDDQAKVFTDALIDALHVEDVSPEVSGRVISRVAARMSRAGLPRLSDGTVRPQAGG